MIKKMFSWSVITFAHLILATVVLCDTESEQFKKYLIDSLDYICKRPGWNELRHLHFQKDEMAINAELITRDNVNESNFVEKLNCITHLLNCEQTNVLNKFNLMLGMILDKCQVLKKNKKLILFVNCTNKLRDILQSSALVLLKLLMSAKYINGIDLRIISLSLYNPLAIENEIECFYNFAVHLNHDSFYAGIKLEDYPDHTFENIKNVHQLFAKTILNLYTGRKVCGPAYESTIPSSLFMRYNVEQMEKFKADSNDFVNDMEKDMHRYFTYIAETYYYGLGFDQMVETNSFSFTHCTGKDYELNEEIQLYNHLLTHVGWKNLKHLSIKNKLTKWQMVNIDSAITEVDRDNYNYVRANVTQILRCRYVELFQYFYDTLKSLSYTCEYENKRSCAISLFQTIVKSDDVFQNMLFALITVRSTAHNRLIRKTTSSIESLMQFWRDFVYNMKRKYRTTRVFENPDNYEAIGFLEDFKKFIFIHLRSKIKKTFRIYLRHCSVGENSDWNDFVAEFKKLNSPLTEHTNVHQTMCRAVGELFEKINIENYKNFGFHDIRQQIQLLQ